MVLSSKQKRSFHTILSGLKFAKYGGKSVRFLTLTSSLLWAQSEGSVPGVFNDDFQKLRKRICRCSPYKLFQDGYITRKQLSFYYKRDEWCKPFSFDYFKVETNEGNGVLHILYRGSYLPYNFIVDNWQDIHLSWEVNIMSVDFVRFNNLKNVSSYIVSQYVSSQDCSYVRSSQSQHWVYPGFKTRWYDLKYQYRHFHFDISIYDMYDNILSNMASSYFYPQFVLSDFG